MRGLDVMREVENLEMPVSDKAFERLSVGSLVSGGGNAVYHVIKRLFDIVCSVLAAVVLSPMLAVISIIVKLSDGGTVLYKHYRVGKGGESIGVYKFRSMKMNTDRLEDILTEEQLEEYHREFKIRNDPRITKIGRFLRSTSLDELPQLINILKGEMSIVGPRPIVEEELSNYTEPQIKRLLSVKPGLTGYWQAYARNNARYDSGRRQEMELYYVENAGLWLDTKIILMTVVSVVRRYGAQ
jgi:lipopolysaccharide/colanic/teichoic acid biosynthesis glycosyltransferase